MNNILLNPVGIGIIIVILIIFFTAFIASLMIQNKYSSMSKDLADEENQAEGMFHHKVFNIILKEYKVAAKGNGNQINTQAIIERNFAVSHKNMNLGERFIKHSVSLMIILGLLGTFYGLTLSIGQLVEFLSNSSVDTIVSGLISSVKGMSVAFVTSLFGIACSILLTILNIIFNVEEAREELMVQMEEYLDNTVAIEVSTGKDSEYALFMNVLRATMEELGDKIENNFKYGLDGISEHLTMAAREMGASSESLLKSVEAFDESLKDFKENTRDFSEFNYHLRTNIERMSISFADLIEGLKEYSNSQKRIM